MLKEKGSYHTVTRCFMKQYNVMAKDGIDSCFRKYSGSFSALSKEITCKIFAETFDHFSTVFSNHQKENKEKYKGKLKHYSLDCCLFVCLFSRKGTIPKVFVPFFFTPFFFFFLVVVKESSGEDKLLLDSHKPPIHSKFRKLRNTHLTSRSKKILYL